jgi:GT2 family glycosyltransferase
MCLSGDVLKGVDQKPFGGKIKYDYIMWIDSDVLFSVEQFVALLASAPKNPIVSGVYRMTNGEYAAVEKWDTEYFKKNGHFKFLKEEDINDYAKRTGPQVLVSVSYSGMGFMLIQRGVFEALSYPWFKPIEKKIGDAVDFTMEDVCFCLRAKHAGYKVLIDPRIRVGHEKSMII